MGFGERAAAVYFLRSSREIARRIPDDFILRVGAALDETTKAGLEPGMAALRTIRRLDRYVLRFLLAGIGILLGGFLFFGSEDIPGLWSLFGSRIPGSVLWIAGLSFAAWVVAAGLYAFTLFESLAHAEGIRRLWSFYEHERRASLARDLG